MLNEELEYEEIISGVRPGKKAFRGDLEGIRRPLLIIARKKIEEFSGDRTNKDELITFVKKSLADYCISNDISEDKVNSFLEDTMFQVAAMSLKSRSKSTVHRISFDDIIAEALYRGNLRKWILSYKNADLLGVTWKGTQIDLAKDEYKESWTRVLKIVSCYLINKHYSGQDENVIKWADIAAWLGLGSFEYGKHVKFFEYNGKRIFEQRNISGVIKITPSEEFLRQFEFRLLEEFSETNVDDFIYCEDQGVGKLLKLSLTSE